MFAPNFPNPAGTFTAGDDGAYLFAGVATASMRTEDGDAGGGVHFLTPPLLEGDVTPLGGEKVATGGVNFLAPKLPAAPSSVACEPHDGFVGLTTVAVG